MKIVLGILFAAAGGCFGVIADLALWMTLGSMEPDPSAGGAFAAAFILTAPIAFVIGSGLAAVMFWRWG